MTGAIIWIVTAGLQNPPWSSLIPQSRDHANIHSTREKRDDEISKHRPERGVL